MTIGEKVREVRTNLLGMESKELASKLGISPKTLASYEIGTRLITPPLLQELSRLAGISIEYFLDERSSSVNEWKEIVHIRNMLVHSVDGQFREYMSVIRKAEELDISPAELRSLPPMIKELKDKVVNELSSSIE